MRTLATAVASLLLAFVPAQVVNGRKEMYRPVVMMHGMNQDENHLNRNMDALRQRYKGIYVISLNISDGWRSMVTHVEDQVQAVKAIVESDPRLANGFNFYGESQGALIARAFVTVHNKPPVYNLIAINGPQAGVGECPKVEAPIVKQVCGILGTDLSIYHWPGCAFCDYWKGSNKELYLERSRWLADRNNDRVINQTYRNHMISLNKYMVTVALNDTIVQPPQSAWHTYWQWGNKWRSHLMELNETEGYQTDALGLKTLHERGDLIMNSFVGHHLGYTMEWWTQTVLPMFDNRVEALEVPAYV